MSIDKQVLLTLRVIQWIFKEFSRVYKTSGKRYERIFIQAGLNDEAIESIRKVFLSMVLMTSGNVKSVRDPSSFESYKAKPLKEILATTAPYMRFYEAIGLDVNARPTMADYQMAHTLLKEMGSSSLTDDYIRQQMAKFSDQAVQDKSDIEIYNMQIPKKLYRGLHHLEVSSIVSLMNVGGIWDITRAVSTTMDPNTAEDFATEGGNSAILDINNPNQVGFLASALSLYESEFEVILAGNLKIDKWSISVVCSGLLESPDGSQKKARSILEIFSQDNSVYIRHITGFRNDVDQRHPVQDSKKFFLDLLDGTQSYALYTSGSKYTPQTCYAHVGAAPGLIEDLELKVYCTLV
jgi:hypothetical protein